VTSGPSPLSTAWRGGQGVRHSLLIALLALTGFAPRAHAQQPTVSPAVARLLRQDTRVAVWLFALPQYPLSDVATAVTTAGGRVRRTSRWLHAVSATVTGPALATLERSSLLRHIQPVAVFVGPVPPRGQPLPRPTLAPGAAAQDSFGPSGMPFRRLHLLPLAGRGFRGQGITIAMLDTGFETELPAFASANVVAQHDFVFDDSVVRDQSNDAAGASNHGTSTWSLLAAYVPGNVIGVAPAANYVLAKTEDVRSETRVEEDNYVAALEWADSLGAKIVSSSLGYLSFDNGFSYSYADLNGNVAVTTVAADMAAQRGITVVTAVGNTGPNSGTLETPSDGDSVIAVGAEDSLGNLASFSSRGPTADGRIKPDLVAPGVSVAVIDGQGGLVRASGTSFATPLIAGAAALIRQVDPQLTGVEVGDALRRAGNNAAFPNNDRGWGLPDALVAATFPYGVVVASPKDTLFNSVTPSFTWSAPGVPSFANPVTYHLVVTRADPAGPARVVDTVLQGGQVTIKQAQRPAARISYTLQATAADSATLVAGGGTQYVVPPWADLLTLDDPGGTTANDPRPVLRWSAPAVLTPPGPFTFDVEIFRTDTREVVSRATGLDSTSWAPSSDLDLNTPYRWRVISHLGADTAITESQGAFVVANGSVPSVTLLFQNFPNPFPNLAIGEATTCFWFDLAHSGDVRLQILDLRGHLVRTLIPGDAFTEPLPAGRYGRPGGAAGGRCDPSLQWDGRAEDGRVVLRGIYLAKLVTPDGVFFKRIVYLGQP
jgi:serine protease AprX